MVLDHGGQHIASAEQLKDCAMAASCCSRGMANDWRREMKFNSAPEWQAGSLRWRSREFMAACLLEGLVWRLSLLLARQAFKRLIANMGPHLLNPPSQPAAPTEGGSGAH